MKLFKSFQGASVSSPDAGLMTSLRAVSRQGTRTQAAGPGGNFMPRMA
jgi:hypothetical protein